MTELNDRSRRVKLVGKLVSAKPGSRTITIQLDTDQSVDVQLSESLLDASPLVGERVILDARASFGPAGELVRFEVDFAQRAPEANSFFSRLPEPPPAASLRERLQVPQGPDSGINAIFGRWPGDESEEEIIAALKAL
jgi:hypothetical protein